MASTYLSKTFTETNRKTFTFSAWIKRSKISSSSNNVLFSTYTSSDFYTQLYFRTGDDLQLYNRNASTGDAYKAPSMKFRDTNGWYHIVVAVDTTQSTANDRIKFYVNGELQTSFAENLAPSQNYIFRINGATEHQLGATNGGSYFDGSMTHIHFIDGTAYDADTFGSTDSTTGIWKPKTNPSVTYGTNGFFLDFASSSDMGNDISGNNNDWTVNGSMTQTIDTPSNVFATLNTLTLSASQYAFKNGNLTTDGNLSSSWRSLVSTLGVSQGKYYFEMKVNQVNSGDLDNIILGITDYEQSDDNTSANGKFFAFSRGYGYHAKNGDKLNNDAVTANGVSYGDSWTTNDIIGCAFDLDNGKIYFSKNGTWQNSGDPTSGATGTGSAFDITTGYTYFPVVANYYSQEKVSFNFGNGYFGTTAVASAGTNSGIGTFEYDVPSGYKALCTKNINEQEYD